MSGVKGLRECLLLDVSVVYIGPHEHGNGRHIFQVQKHRFSRESTFRSIKYHSRLKMVLLQPKLMFPVVLLLEVLTFLQ